MIALPSPWLAKKKYKYAPELTLAATFGQGVLAIEHPESAGTTEANLAGLKSALRVYEKILAQDAKAKVDLMEDLLQQEKKDGLQGFGAEAAKGCK